MALTLVFDVKSWQDLGCFCPTVKLVGLQWNVKNKYIFVYLNNNLKKKQKQPGSMTDMSDSSAPVFQTPNSPPCFITAHFKFTSAGGETSKS